LIKSNIKGGITLANNDVLEKVKEILVNELDIDLLDILPGSQLINDLGADSLHLLEINMRTEDVFGIKIDEEEYGRVASVEDLVKIIERNIQ
jgi:acyl carrier protein